MEKAGGVHEANDEIRMRNDEGEMAGKGGGVKRSDGRKTDVLSL